MLSPRFQRLLEGYKLAQSGPPRDLAKAVRSLPRVGRLPSPWETRALPVLLEYRRNKLHEAMAELSTHWGDFVNFIRLRRQGPGCSAAVSSLAAIEPSLTSEWPDDLWTSIGRIFEFEPTDDDDFLTDDESDDGQFNHPAPGMLTITTIDLMEAGALITKWSDPPYYWAFAIADEVLEHEAVITAFFEDAQDPEVKVWPHACVGDWIASHEVALANGNATLSKLTGERAEQCREDRHDRILLQMVRDKGVTPRVLKALYDFEPAYAAPHLADALMVDYQALRTAMAIVATRDDWSWRGAVVKLFRSLGYGGDPDEVTDLAEASGAADVLKLFRADEVPRASQLPPTPADARPPACAASPPQCPPESPDGNAKPDLKKLLASARAKFAPIKGPSSGRK
jgi:hypothetical protein